MARLVGLEVARLVEVLRLDPAKVHIIGHSLGAHIAGYAGERIPGQQTERESSFSEYCQYKLIDVDKAPLAQAWAASPGWTPRSRCSR